MNAKSAAFAAFFGLMASLAHAGATAEGSDPAACREGPLDQFGRYIGDWKIDDQVLAKDGASWGPGNAERWIFECIGDGVAIQDYWLPKGGKFGTNLRTYNPDSGKWEIVWAATSQHGLMHIEATQNDDGDIVMTITAPPQDRPKRIIFHTPDETGWNWVQQWSFDDGETWTDVYRIRATPWEDSG